MEDLLKITKNYYKKTEQEKLIVRDMIYADLIQIVQEENLRFIEFVNLTENYVKIMVEREDYEIADVITILSRKLIKEHYGIK